MAGLLGPRATTDTGGNVPLQTRRKYDRSDFIVFKEVRHSPMLTKVLQSGNKKVAGDAKYYMYEDDYEKFEFEVTGSDSGGSSAQLTTSVTYIHITNLEDYIQAGDTIHLPAGDDNQNTADGTVAAAGEDLLITEVMGANHAKVERFGGVGANNRNCSNSAAGNKITGYLASNANHEGATSRTALSGALEEDYNYARIHRLSWEVTGTNYATDMYGGNDEQLEARRKRKTFVRNIERCWWFGHRYIKRVQGRPKRYSGGWLEYIADTSSGGTRLAVYDSTKDLVTGDGSQRIWKAGNNWSLDNWNYFMEAAFEYGNDRKTGYCGPKFITVFENKLRPYVRMEWKQTEIGQRVATYQSTHGTIEFQIEPEFYGEHAYDLVVIDDQYSWYRYLGKCVMCNAGSRDIHVHKSIEDNDADTAKHELFAEIGPDQKFRNAHSWLDGS